MLKIAGVGALLLIASSLTAGESVDRGEGDALRTGPVELSPPLHRDRDRVGIDLAAGSVWDSVFTAEQAQRGATAYARACARCHGGNGNGAGDPDMPPSPSVARAGFITRWNGKTVKELFSLVRTTMPQDNPGQLNDQEFVDIIAHMLALSGAPAGPRELPSDTVALADIVIVPRPSN